MISREMSQPLCYSRGRAKFDNAPEQRQAATFEEFEKAVLEDRSPQKGLAYVCAPLTKGPHYREPGKFSGLNHWRLKNYAEPRAYLPFDFDGFASPADFLAIKEYLQRYRGFGYTTARHTEEFPRARAILSSSRPVSRAEGIAVCQALQVEMQAHVDGKIDFDESVYRGEQPIYCPVTTSDTFSFHGAVVDVEAYLAKAPVAHSAPQQQTRREYIGEFHWPEKILDGEGREDFILRAAGHLRGKGTEQSLIERILLDYNSVHIDPPLDESVVLDRACRYQESSSAEYTDKPLFDIHAASAGRFFDKPAPEQQWILKGFLPAKVVGIVVAPGGTGKSWFLAQLCASVVTGLPLAGKWEVA